MTNHVEIQSIGQIAIAVTELDRATEFYRDVLGLEFLFDAPPGLAFFNCGDVRLMLTCGQGDKADHATSVVYYKVQDLDATTAALKIHHLVFEQEAQLVAKMPDHELWMAFIRDPDKNLIGIMAEHPLE